VAEHLAVDLSGQIGLESLLSIGVFYWILLGLFQGVEGLHIEDRARRLPNQGVRCSLYNSVLLALISSGIAVLSGMLHFGLLYGLLLPSNTSGGSGFSSVLSASLFFAQGFGRSVGWLVAVCGGLLVWASRGGLAVLCHYVIRLRLARSHTFPWHATQFLEEATARILLRRVGGGYSFPHRLFLDYFADLAPTASTASLAAHPAQPSPPKLPS
jgi:hypothetical protein